MSIEEIVYELIDNGVICAGVIARNGALAYIINGFAKSGTGTLYMSDDKICLLTRYGTVIEIKDIYDVIAEAYAWDKGYSFSLNYPHTDFLTPANHWYRLYVKYGFVKHINDEPMIYKEYDKVCIVAGSRDESGNYYSEDTLGHITKITYGAVCNNYTVKIDSTGSSHVFYNYQLRKNEEN